MHLFFSSFRLSTDTNTKSLKTVRFTNELWNVLDLILNCLEPRIINFNLSTHLNIVLRFLSKMAANRYGIISATSVRSYRVREKSGSTSLRPRSVPTKAEYAFWAFFFFKQCRNFFAQVKTFVQSSFCGVNAFFATVITCKGVISFILNIGKRNDPWIISGTCMKMETSESWM